MNINDFLNDKDLIEQARQAAKAEAEAYRKQQYEELRKLAFEQLKAKFLAEEKAKIDKEVEQTRKEFDWGDVKFEPIEGLPDPEKINADFESTKTEAEIKQIKETAKENAPKSGHDAYELMKNFYDSDVDSATKDKVRFLPSDEALVYVEMLNEGLTPEEIEEKGFKEIKPENEETEVQQTEETQKDGFWKHF